MRVLSCPLRPCSPLFSLRRAPSARRAAETKRMETEPEPEPDPGHLPADHPDIRGHDRGPPVPDTPKGRKGIRYFEVRSSSTWKEACVREGFFFSTRCGCVRAHVCDQVAAGSGSGEACPSVRGVRPVGLSRSCVEVLAFFCCGTRCDRGTVKHTPTTRELLVHGVLLCAIVCKDVVDPFRPCCYFSPTPCLARAPPQIGAPVPTDPPFFFPRRVLFVPDVPAREVRRSQRTGRGEGVACLPASLESSRKSVLPIFPILQAELPDSDGLGSEECVVPRRDVCRVLGMWYAEYRSVQTRQSDAPMFQQLGNLAWPGKTGSATGAALHATVLRWRSNSHAHVGGARWSPD